MRRLAVLAVLALAAGCVAEEKQPTGAEDFATFCAGCHGAAGKGDGPGAAGLPRHPANLTTLAKRHDGTFPKLRVMAKIWGYTGKYGDTPMPNFGPLLDSPLVPYDAGDGISSPTPLRLVQLAEYVESLQVK